MTDFDCASASTSSLRTDRGFGVIRVLLAIVLLVSVPGCNYIMILGYLLGGPPQEQPLFERDTGKSLTDRDVRVAVMCYAPDELKYNFIDLDHIIASRVTHQLANRKIEVIPYDDVQNWLTQNPDWNHPQDLGADFDVSFVICIDVSNFSLYERNGNTLFRGRCDAMVRVYEMDTPGEGRQIFNYEIESLYPTEVPRSAEEVSFDSFRVEYVFRLSDEIGRLFYPYHRGDLFQSTADLRSVRGAAVRVV
ncbi:MAG: hypothetical protein ACPGXX_01605 [Planctomycetaceae bacterium]